MRLNILDNHTFFAMSNHVESTEAHNNLGREDREMAVTCAYTSNGRANMGEESYISEHSFEGIMNAGSYGEYFGANDQLAVFKYGRETYIIIWNDDVTRIFFEGHVDHNAYDVKHAIRASCAFHKHLKKKAAA